MKNVIVGPIVLAGALMSSVPAHASDACEVVMCMFGLVQGDNSQECQDAIHSYFDVVSYRHGHPDLNQTAKDRLSLTRQCKSTSDQFTSMIDRTFGSVIK